jgi:hypothetical protein
MQIKEWVSGEMLEVCVSTFSEEIVQTAWSGDIDAVMSRPEIELMKIGVEKTDFREKSFRTELSPAA